MRRLLGPLVAALVAAGCTPSAGTARVSTAPTIRIRQSPSPFQQVTAGPVRALIPDGWRPMAAGATGDPQEGFVAAPRPAGWIRHGGAPIEGMAAVWVDGTRVGIPSDYYYLAATGPALDLITGTGRCRATRQHVFADHVPTFAAGPPDSAGDFIARGHGTCRVGTTPTRWAYFVAAPGFGPARAVGIPRSGLYLVVALLPEGPGAPALLDKLLLRTQFGGASMSDFIAATRAGTAA